MRNRRKVKYFIEDQKLVLAREWEKAGIRLRRYYGRQGKWRRPDNSFKLLIAASVVVPLLILVIFFWGGFNLSKITSALNPIFQQKTEINNEESEQNRSELRLISREDFLKKYNPKPAFLPQAIELHSSLSGYIRGNSTEHLLPARNWSVPFEDINTESAVAVDMPSKRILYGKNVFEARPIASLTKIMTALVAVENLNLSDPVTVSARAIRTEGDSARLVTGERLNVEQLLYATLLESSNDAAVAIEDYYNSIKSAEAPDFVGLMNQKAEQLTLKDTSFVEPTGLSAENISNTFEVSQILWAAFENETLARIMNTTNYTVYTVEEPQHYWVNLNTLVGAYEEIIAGKTGYTEEAGPSMAFLAASPAENRYIAVVVLNAEDRIKESFDLLNWVKNAYIWEE